MLQQRSTIATLGSHSALDVCRGAKDLGFETLVVAQKGREKTYSQYYKSVGKVGCVDDCLILDKFDELLTPRVISELAKKNLIWIPNRSFEAYLHFNYSAIETGFKIPFFGNKYLLKIEERSAKPNQYDLLDKASIPYPKHFSDPKEIDRLCLVKANEKERSFERAFFLAKDYAEFLKVGAEMIAAGKMTQQILDSAVIEEFVVGTQVNFNFFYSPIHDRLELLGTDTRRQTNLDGLLRLPAQYQMAAMEYLPVSYEEAGHIAVTVLESLLEPAFAMAERFVKASQEIYSPGIIGPFALQSIVVAGAKKKEIIVIDVSPRMPGSPGIAATPYGRYLFGEALSVGKRVAMEIQDASDGKSLKKILT